MNYELTRYGDCWRIKLMDLMARALRLPIHVDGYPFGVQRATEPHPEKPLISANLPSDNC